MVDAARLVPSQRERERDRGMKGGREGGRDGGISSELVLVNRQGISLQRQELRTGKGQG